MKFSDAFLDELRARLPVSVVVGKVVELKKEGVEFVGLSPFNKERTPSLKCNDQKQIWKDFSSGKGGDVFKFVQETEGCTFQQAVETCAARAGVQLPGGAQTGGRADKRGAQSSDESGRPLHGVGTRAGADREADKPSARRGRREIAATYDYTDTQGSIIYQVVRYEPKGFAQRRPGPEPDTWIWGLGAGDYLRPSFSKDWFSASAEREAEWRGAERLNVPSAVSHGLYRAVELHEETAAAPDERRAVWVPEGERDCDTLVAWGLVATTNSGGAQHWSNALAETFRDCDVVILVDNDDPGRERGHNIAASLRGIARSSKLVDLSLHWTGMPVKGDVTDWAAAGGSAEALFEIVERTAQWQPVAPKSSFGAVRFADIDLPAREHEWLIKGILPRGGVSMLIGKWQSGKSFAATDMALAVATGEPYRGRRAIRGLVLYQAGEAGLGLRQRLRAARSYRGIDPKANIPFVLMPHPLDMYNSDDPVNAFIAEAKAWAAYYEMPVELVVIDTFSAATPGANENASEHVSVILDRGNRIARDTGALVLWVHHLNAAGEKARGHSSLMGNVDAVIEIVETEAIDRERTPTGDIITRTVREAHVIKQKEAERGLRWPFVLKAVEVGRDAEGDPITSCVVVPVGESALPPAQAAASRRGGIFLTPTRLIFFRDALMRALNDHGIAPPAELKLPASVRLVVNYQDVKVAYKNAVLPADDDAQKNAEGLRKALGRLREWFQARSLIGVDATGERQLIWPTGKPVFGAGYEWPPKARASPPSEQQAPTIDAATGEEITSEDLYR